MDALRHGPPYPVAQKSWRTVRPAVDRCSTPLARFMTASAVSSITSRRAWRDRKDRSPVANEQSPDALAICVAGLRRPANQRADPHNATDASDASRRHAVVVVARPLRPGDPHAAAQGQTRVAGRAFGPGWLGLAIATPGVRSPPRQGRPLPNGPGRPGGTHVVINGHGRARVPHVCAILIPPDDPQSGPTPFTGRRGPPRSTRPLQSPLGSQPLRWPAPRSGGPRRR